MSGAAEIARGLEDPEPEARPLATQRIGDLEGVGAAELLLRALGDADWRVRKEAAQIAPMLSPREEIVTALVSAMHDRANIGLRNAVVEALIGVGAAAVPAVIATLTALDADGRKLAVEVLGGVPDPRGARVLADVLGADGDENVRGAAAEALGKSALAGDSARQIAIDALTAVLSSNELFLRLAALDSLTRLDAIVPWEVFRPLANDPLLRRHVIAVAASSRDPEAVAMLASAMGDVSETVGHAAVLALGDCLQADPNDEALIDVARRSPLSPEARARIRKMARATDDPRARGAALITLGLERDATDIPLLLDALADDVVAEHAELGLMLYGGDAIGPIFDAGRRAAPALRAASISIVPLLAPSFESDMLDDLRDALKSPEQDVVLGSLKAISMVGAAQDLAAVARFTADADPRIAAGASTAVYSIATRHIASARVLLEKIDAAGKDAVTGCVLLDAIARSGNAVRDRDVAFLKAALSQGSIAARRASLEALATIGGDTSADAAVFALADEEREVVVAAVRALGRLGRTEPLSSLIKTTRDAGLIAAALRAIGDAAPSECLRAALPLLRGREPAVACAAVEAIGALDSRLENGSAREDALFVALEHADAEVVKLALSELARACSDRVVTRLAACLDHASRDVRKHAAELLGREGSQDARALLRARLESERDPSFRAALNAALVLRPASLDV